MARDRADAASPPTPTTHWRAYIALACTVIVGAIACDRRLRVTVTDARTTFNEHRARALAHTLESGGARATGSAAEANAFAYLFSAARAIADDAETATRGAIVVDVAKDAANARDFIAYDDDDDGGGGGDRRPLWTTAYANLTTVAVRARARRAVDGGYAERAVLISAHVDTVHSSSGGSDNGANCAIALETMRAFIASLARERDEKSNDHDAGAAMCDEARKTCAVVIVLFSTAEEDGLAGARSSATNHAWFDATAHAPIQVILNLESIGAGGPHRMFQAKTTTGVGRRAIEMWARVAPRARGDVLAEDIFNSGVINSGTDYAVYREYAPNVPAMFDFAFCEHTMVYHTPRDRVKYMRPGSFQSAGDNLLAFVSAFAADGGIADDVAAVDEDDQDVRMKPPVSWYTILGYGMVVHDAPNAKASATFVVAPLMALSAFLHKVFIGDFVSPRHTVVPDSVRDRVEHTVRLMVTIPFVASACAACWVFAALSAMLVATLAASALDAPHLFVAHPFSLVALAGGASVATFVVMARLTRVLTHSLLPMTVKMRPTPCASNAVEWSMLVGTVVVWGAIASKTVRAHIGSSSLATMWCIVPTLTVIAPALLPFLARRGCREVPSAPSAERLAFAFAVPLWITAPNIAVLLGILNGVGARAPVSEDMRYAYDAIAAAVVGVTMAAPTSYASHAASRNGAWRVVCACGVIASAAAMVRMTLIVKHGDRAVSGAPWSALAPQPVILTHLTTASRGRATSSVVALARVGSGSVIDVARALNAHESIAGVYEFSCDVANATVDFATTAMRVGGGAACVGRALAGEFALADEAVHHSSGATAPAFTNIARTPSMVSAIMRVGASARWVLAVDKRCVAKLKLASASWVDVGNYTRGRGARFTINGIRGGGTPLPYAVAFEPRAREERDAYFNGNGRAEAEACENAVRVRVDYVARTPAIARIDKALPKFAAPFGKFKSPQWLAFVDSLDV